MDVLRMHFRPEFLNRIDEIIVFHALDRKQISNIVELQLERVKRTAHGQGVDLEVDESLIEQLAAAGFRPEFAHWAAVAFVPPAAPCASAPHGSVKPWRLRPCGANNSMMFAARTAC